jgi:hypothetical protein
MPGIRHLREVAHKHPKLIWEFTFLFTGGELRWPCSRPFLAWGVNTTDGLEDLAPS